VFSIFNLPRRRRVQFLKFRR